MKEDSTKTLGKVIRIDDERIQDHLKHMVRGWVEETFKALLDAEGSIQRSLLRYSSSPIVGSLYSPYGRLCAKSSGLMSVRGSPFGRQVGKEL